MHTKITKRVLESTPPPTHGTLFLRDTELTGFGARVSQTGSISFFAEGRLRRSRNKRVSLGRYPVVSVENAREKARETLYKLTNGIDPVREERERLEAKQKAHALEHACSITLAAVIDDYFKSRPIKSEADYRAVFKNGFGDWLNAPVRNITRQDIENRYRKIAFTDGHKAQATKAMRYLGAVMNFAKGEYVEGQPLITRNPVAVLSDKKVDRTVKPRSTHIKRAQLPAFVNAVRASCSETARDLLLLEILTGLRDQETKTLKWTDVDFKSRTFAVRATKNGKDHTLPMATAVHDLLRARWQSRAHKTYVFPNRDGSGPLGSIRKQIRRVKKKTGITFTHHDLRRTFASLLASELKADTSTIARLLNHAPRGVTEKHYIQSRPSDFIELYEKLGKLVLDAVEDMRHANDKGQTA